KITAAAAPAEVDGDAMALHRVCECVGNGLAVIDVALAGVAETNGVIRGRGEFVPLFGAFEGELQLALLDSRLADDGEPPGVADGIRQPAQAPPPGAADPGRRRQRGKLTLVPEERALRGARAVALLVEPVGVHQPRHVVVGPGTDRVEERGFFAHGSYLRTGKERRHSSSGGTRRGGRKRPMRTRRGDRDRSPERRDSRGSMATQWKRPFLRASLSEVQ